VLETCRAEIQEQPTAATSDAEIVDHLRYLDGTDGVQGLQLHQNLAIADEIDGIGEGRDPIAIAHWQTRFADEWYAPFLKFDSERLATHCFQKAAPELTMNRPMIS
jgi:hypothetical protein